jgi:hypothetical protein
MFDFLGQLFASESFRGAVLFAGVVIAFVSVLTARALARKKQTADLMFAMRHDEKMHSGIRLIARNHTAGLDIARFAKDAISEEAQLVRYVLNHYETISVGIQAGIYDEDMLKRCFCGTLISTYDKSLPLIHAIRHITGKKTTFDEIQWLGERWRAKPLKPKNSGAA